MILVALVGVQALEFDLQAAIGKKVETSPDMVSTFIESYDMRCWQSHCMDKCMSCAEEVQKCRDHFFCPFSPAECFQNVRWADLAPEEVKVFDCAKDNNCVAHGPASFIEIAMRSPHGKAAEAAAKAGVMSPTEAVEAAKIAAAEKAKVLVVPAASETPVLDVTMKHLAADINRGLTSVADHATFVAKAQERVTNIGARLQKMYEIKHPTAADTAELMDLIRQMSVIHDAQEVQFNEFSKEGVSSMLQTGTAEPSRLYRVLAKLADFHAPEEAAEALLQDILGIKSFHPISHIEFNGNTDFHHADNHLADAGAVAKGNETDPTESEITESQAPATEPEQQGKTQSTTESPEQLEAEEEQKAKQAVEADEKKYWEGNDESSIDQLKNYDSKKDKDLQAIHNSFQDMRDEMDGIDHTLEGNTTGMNDLEKMEHLSQRVTPAGPLPDSFAQASSFAEVGKAKATFSLAEVERAAEQVASTAAKVTGRMEAKAVKGFAAADRALGVDVDADGHLRLHK